MMVDHLGMCSTHAHCLSSEPCVCAKYASAKQKSLLNSNAFQCQGPGSDNRALSKELRQGKCM